MLLISKNYLQINVNKFGIDHERRHGDNPQTL